MKFGVKENIYVTIVSRNNDRNKRKHLYKNYESVGATLPSQYQEGQPEKVVDLMIAATFITSKIDTDIQIQKRKGPVTNNNKGNRPSKPSKLVLRKVREVATTLTSKDAKFSFMDIAAPLIQASLIALRETAVNEETMMERMNHNRFNSHGTFASNKSENEKPISFVDRNDSGETDTSSSTSSSNDESDNKSSDETMQNSTHHMVTKSNINVRAPQTNMNTSFRGGKAHRRVVSAMPDIQGLPKDFDITKLSSLDKGGPRATHQARIMRSHQNLAKSRKRSDRKNQHLQPEIGEIVEEKWQFETTIDDVQLQCIAKGMDPGEVFIHKLNFVSGENSIGQQSRRSHDVRTFHTINFASGRAVLKHTGLDENGALVLAYPTINLENFDVSISSNSPNSVERPDKRRYRHSIKMCP